MPHIHIGAIFAITSFLNVILVGTIWRVIAMRLSQSPIGQAMAIMY